MIGNAETLGAISQARLCGFVIPDVPHLGRDMGAWYSYHLSSYIHYMTCDGLCLGL